MATLNKLLIHWSGAGVTGPGISTMYFDPTAPSVPAGVAAFFTAIASRIPNDVSWAIDNGGDQIDVASGYPTSVWGSSGSTTVVGSGTTTYTQGVGARIVWGTGGFLRGRRIRGTTFLVPALASNYGSNGFLLSAAATAFQGAAQSLLTNVGNLMYIYTRPKAHVGGGSNVVLSASCPTAATWLTSRRT